MKRLLIVLFGMGIVLIVGMRIWIHLFPVKPIPQYVEQNIVQEVVAAPIPTPVQVKPKSIPTPVPVKPKPTPAKAIPKPRKQFKCDGRKHCSQMRSYDEAKYFNDYCPNTKMDGDHDGIPCERQFRRY